VETIILLILCCQPTGCFHSNKFLTVDIDCCFSPTSNLKLASGMCRVGNLLTAGANVALGTDSSASNNRLDMMAEMKLAAVLAKAVADDPMAVPAFQALQMATINGARALGLAADTGSLQPGKWADMVAVRLVQQEGDDGDDDAFDPGLTPLYDVVSHLVYAATHSNVDDVWVAGRCLMHQRQLQTVDMAQVRRTAREWQNKVAAAASADAAAASQ
jgi:5-methylthioadenosine/S-adenosylhomocysteine deaminase